MTICHKMLIDSVETCDPAIEIDTGVCASERAVGFTHASASAVTGALIHTLDIRATLAKTTALVFIRRVFCLVRLAICLRVANLKQTSLYFAEHVRAIIDDFFRH